MEDEEEILEFEEEDCAHDVESEGCWCKPEVLQNCPDCVEELKVDKNCWRCKGRGLVKKYCEEEACVIVHHHIDDIIDSI